MKAWENFQIDNLKVLNNQTSFPERNDMFLKYIYSILLFQETMNHFSFGLL